MKKLSSINDYNDFLLEYYLVLPWHDILAKVPFCRTSITAHCYKVLKMKKQQARLPKRYNVTLHHDDEVIKSVTLHNAAKVKKAMNGLQEIPKRLKNSRTFTKQWFMQVSIVNL